MGAGASEMLVDMSNTRYDPRSNAGAGFPFTPPPSRRGIRPSADSQTKDHQRHQRPEHRFEKFFMQLTRSYLLVRSPAERTMNSVMGEKKRRVRGYDQECILNQAILDKERFQERVGADPYSTEKQPQPRQILAGRLRAENGPTSAAGIFAPHFSVDGFGWREIQIIEQMFSTGNLGTMAHWNLIACTPTRPLRQMMDGPAIHSSIIENSTDLWTINFRRSCTRQTRSLSRTICTGPPPPHIGPP